MWGPGCASRCLPLPRRGVAAVQDAPCGTRTQVAGSSSERLARWTVGWYAGRTAFHRTVVAPTLLENEMSFLSPKASNLRVLVPLCGTIAPS